MNDEELIERFRQITEHLISVGRDLSELKACANVLRIHAALQLSPDDPQAALAKFQKLEKALLDSDPNEQERKKAEEIIDAVKEWRKMGGRHNEA